MHAVAEGEPLGAHTSVELGAKCRRELHVRAQQPVPNIHGRRRSAGRLRRTTAHALFAPARDFDGAPVNPFAAPIPSISSQRGQGPEGAPFSARSITNCAMRSTTCLK